VCVLGRNLRFGPVARTSSPSVYPRIRNSNLKVWVSDALGNHAESETAAPTGRGDVCAAHYSGVPDATNVHMFINIHD
jgi:hypothetical protein